MFIQSHITEEYFNLDNNKVETHGNCTKARAVTLEPMDGWEKPTAPKPQKIHLPQARTGASSTQLGACHLICGFPIY